MNVVQENQWDITDIYESDLTGGKTDKDFMYIITFLGEGEVVKIEELEECDVSEELRRELEQVQGYTINDRILRATVNYTGVAGNVRLNATKFYKAKTVPGQYCILILQDSDPNGRGRKKKRTSSAVTDVKPTNPLR
ncbi:MAG: hypothetical protein HWE22_10050 [Flavobacteriales bacterium]|nr:hypothetical protein [Flavobacteriales bacterium]